MIEAIFKSHQNTMNKFISQKQLETRSRTLIAFLFSLWLLTIIVPTFFARELSQSLPGWPLHYWISAQGALLVFVLLVVVYAALVNHWESQLETQETESSDKRP